MYGALPPEIYFVRRGTKKSGNGEAGSKKLFPGFILTEMLKTFSFTGMNKTLNNEQDEQE